MITTQPIQPAAQKRTYTLVSSQLQGNPMQLPPQMVGRLVGTSSNKKRKLSDRIVSSEITSLIPEADAYLRLLSFEQKLDATLNRKRLDIQESLKRPNKIKKKLRIFVSHTFTPGREPEREGDEGSVPMWELRVEGKVIDDQNAAAVAASSSKPLPKRKFSSFFKSLVIELDKDIYGPDNHLVEWHRTTTTNETDGFQVKRPGDKDVKCTILLLLDYQPLKYKLNPRLSKLLGIPMETRPKIIEALWQYVKTHKLQDPTDRDVINCDQYLEQIFNRKKMRFMEIPQCLQQMLYPPDPLVLNHIVKRDPEKQVTCYDIEVEIDDPVKYHASTFLQNHMNVPDISLLDQRIYDLIDQLKEQKARRDFYAAFSDDPVGFVQKWLSSQSRDLKNISNLYGDYETERRSEHYFQPTVEEGVHRYIYGKVLQKRLELESSLGIRNN